MTHPRAWLAPAHVLRTRGTIAAWPCRVKLANPIRSWPHRRPSTGIFVRLFLSALFRFPRLGTSFPAMQVRQSPESIARTRPRDPPAGLILLVEDDPFLRSSLSELLGAEGYRVDCCMDGREAFRRLHQPPRPDLIILDLVLPHLDGVELLSMQKKMPLLAKIPVVVISALDLDQEILTELAISPPFRKPLDIDGLLSRIRDLTNG